MDVISYTPMLGSQVSFAWHQRKKEPSVRTGWSRCSRVAAAVKCPLMSMPLRNRCTGKFLVFFFACLKRLQWRCMIRKVL